MDSAMTRESLAQVFDQVLREVTQREAGICLRPGELDPNGDLCTVYVTFDQGFHTGLSLCAETALFTRLTQTMMQTKDITDQDLEDFTKEYFNVLCGQIAVRLFQVTKVASRFSTPLFFHGQYVPDNCQDHITITYTSDDDESARLVHHKPIGRTAGPKK